MTWSIIARDASGAFGVAMASKFFAVGALCPHARSGVGAVSTQALVNPLYAAPALDGLAQGLAPAQVIERLTATDEGREHRQVHLIGADGKSAAYTGSCLRRLVRAHGRRRFLGRRQHAGRAAGHRGDRRGLPGPCRLAVRRAPDRGAGGGRCGRRRQAGQAGRRACWIHTTEDYCALDIRVDDHPEPIQELQRLYDKSLERFQPFTACLPSRRRPAGITDRAVIEAEIERFQARRAGRPHEQQGAVKANTAVRSADVSR